MMKDRGRFQDEDPTQDAPAPDAEAMWSQATEQYYDDWHERQLENRASFPNNRDLYLEGISRKGPAEEDEIEEARRRAPAREAA